MKHPLGLLDFTQWYIPNGIGEPGAMLCGKLYKGRKVYLFRMDLAQLKEIMARLVAEDQLRKVKE